MSQGFDSQLPSENSIYGKNTENKPPQKPKNKALPSGLFILALFCLLFGGIGLFTSFGTVTSYFSDKEEDVDQIYMEFHQEIRNMPSEYFEKYSQLLNKDSFVKYYQYWTEGVEKHFPDMDLYYLLGAFLSLVSCFGAVGVFLKKDWGRQMLIFFFIFSTLSIVLSSYYMLSHAQGFVEELIDKIGISELNNIDLSMFFSIMDTGWKASSAAIIILHGGVVFYLYSKKVKAVFVEETMANEGRYFS